MLLLEAVAKYKPLAVLLAGSVSLLSVSLLLLSTVAKYPLLTDVLLLFDELVVSFDDDEVLSDEPEVILVGLAISVVVVVVVVVVLLYIGLSEPLPLPATPVAITY